jgi:hypothetical protein
LTALLRRGDLTALRLYNVRRGGALVIAGRALAAVLDELVR